MPINTEHLASLTDADVIDQNGDKVGAVGQIYLDDATGQPAWASVKSGLFGLRESFVPLQTAEVANGNISVPFTKDVIKDAPRVDADNHLDDSQQATLYSYYGLERPSAAAPGGGGDPSATFGSEQTAADLSDGRTEGLPTSPADEGQTQVLPTTPAAEDQDGAVTEEYTTPGATQEPPATVSEGGNDLGSGDVATDEAGGTQGDSTTERAAAIGAAGAAGAVGAGAAGADREPRPGDPDWDETHHATFQQENPAAQTAWAAEQAPEEPVSTTWSVPSTEPADEEPTQVERSGYSSDRPAAHSSAYEGHHAAAATPPADAPVLDERTDEGAIYAADADAADSGPVPGTAAPGDAAPADVDSGQFGTVAPVTGDESTDDAVTGAPAQTGTGYPDDVPEAGAQPETTGVGAGGAVLGGAVAGGVAAAGVAASDTETTSYEVPGQEAGKPTTEAQTGPEFAADREEPFDASTEPQEDSEATFAAGTDAGEASGEPTAGNDPETFGAMGYRPDRDGSDMTDEERERLNRARGAL